MSTEFSSIFCLDPKTPRFLKLSQPESAFLFKGATKTDLLTGKVTSSSPEELVNFLHEISLFNESFGRVIHLTYDFGRYLVEKRIPSYEEELGIVIKYTKESHWFPKPDGDMFLTRTDQIAIEDYASAFNRGYQHLLDGDTYQFNLTFPFRLEGGNVSIDNFFQGLLKKKALLGGYAHATYIPLLERHFLSNSPECLFQISRKKDQLKIWTMPIKGTVKISSIKDRASAWNKLCSSKKESGELNMITDLLRNDLCRFCEDPIDLISMRRPLYAPGIVHAYSLIAGKSSKRKSLMELLFSIFPGGSITGAPKLRTMEILGQIEAVNRRYYCGSTILLHREKLCASINIRSLEYQNDEEVGVYGAGGGITLLSQLHEEYREMQVKLDSFCRVFESSRYPTKLANFRKNTQVYS